jgi:alpha-ketoglutarate-dependent taurine dioxygenase
MGPQLHDGRVYEVAVREAGKGLTDQHGNTIVSTTAHSFELHTDGYNRPEPPRFVFLLRTDGGVGGPASFVSRSDQAIARLNASTRDALTRAEYPSAAGPIPLLDVPAPSLHRLRFNGTEIEQWSGRGPNPDLGDQQRETLHALAHELRSVRATFTIAPGDCLVLDNWRVCHGRASMSRSSKRVLSRVWVV